LNRPWPVDALEFEESVRAAFTQPGGFEFTRECEIDPDRRTEVGERLKTMQVDELDFSADEIEAAAAALACRAAGRLGLPWPLVQQLTARAVGGDVDAVYLVDGAPRRAEHLDLAGRAVAFDVRRGSAHELIATGPASRMPLDPFGAPCRLGEAAPEPPLQAITVSTVLAAYLVLGALETAVELASGYSFERQQFGRPIYQFGAIQWRLADLAVDLFSLTEIAGFTLSRAIEGTATLADTWALRLQMLDSAGAVLTNAHQVFGAIGLCEEHDLVIIDRHLQGHLRRPFGEAATASALAAQVAEQGFDLLYPIEPAATRERAAAA